MSSETASIIEFHPAMTLDEVKDYRNPCSNLANLFQRSLFLVCVRTTRPTHTNNLRMAGSISDACAMCGAFLFL
jgi:hypothetical protein